MAFIFGGSKFSQISCFENLWMHVACVSDSSGGKILAE